MFGYIQNTAYLRQKDRLCGIKNKERGLNKAPLFLHSCGAQTFLRNGEKIKFFIIFKIVV